MQAKTTAYVVKADSGAFGVRTGNAWPVRIVDSEAHSLKRQITRFHPMNIRIVNFRDEDCVRLTIIEIPSPRRRRTRKGRIGTDDHHIICENRLIRVRATRAAVLTTRVVVLQLRIVRTVPGFVEPVFLVKVVAIHKRQD